MSFRPFAFLVGSCLVAFAFALSAFMSGAGFVAAFLIYSFVGSATLLTVTMVAFLAGEEFTTDVVTSDAIAPNQI